MTASTFSDFVATQDARNDIQLNIRKYTLMLCDCLTDDFTRSHPNSDPYKFYIESGRKYHKIVMETNGQSRSVHAFVDKKTGEVYKPASYKAPAKMCVTIFLWLSLAKNVLPAQIGQEVISMFDELFPGTIDQLNKLTVVRYDHIKETNAQRDEELRRSKHTNKGGKVSSLC